MSENDERKKNGNGRNGQPRRRALDLRLALNALSCPSSNDLRLFGLVKIGVSGSARGLI